MVVPSPIVSPSPRIVTAPGGAVSVPPMISLRSSVSCEALPMLIVPSVLSMTVSIRWMLPPPNAAMSPVALVAVTLSKVIVPPNALS